MKFFITLLVAFAAVAAEAKTIMLTTGNTVTLRGVVDETSVSKAQRELIDLIKARKYSATPIYLVLDTPGGSVVAGESFIEFAKSIPNLHTITIFAASMGSGIVQALQGRRYIVNSGVSMYHRASIGLSTTELEKAKSMLEFYEQVINDMEQRTATRLCMPLSEYKLKVADEWWMTAKQAIANKAADEIVDVQCSQVLIDRRDTLARQSFFGTIKLTYSACPLLQYPLPE